MFGKRFECIHGWVEGIQTNPDSGECLLMLRLDNMQTIMLTAHLPNWIVQIGNEISAAVKNSNPSHAVALVDHMAGDGAILPKSERQFPDWEDATITTTMLGLTLYLSGWSALPVFALVVLAYGLMKYWLPEMIRRREMSRITHLIDCDYRLWRRC